jgi:hypothetical protein
MPAAAEPRRAWSAPRVIGLDAAKAKSASCSGSDGDIGS